MVYIALGILSVAGYVAARPHLVTGGRFAAEHYILAGIVAAVGSVLLWVGL